MELIKIINFKISFGNRDLFNIPELNINTNEKIGLIGNNGVSKTTLLKAIDQNNSLNVTHGKIVKKCSTIFVPQLLDYGGISGGERERQAIDKAIYNLKREPNSLLLLDEPTSNLDINQQKWLINILNARDISLLVVSHDRDFLNSVVNTIWCIKDKKVTQFNGKYSDYEKFEQTKKQKEEAAFNVHQHRIARLKKASTQKLQQGKAAKKLTHNKSKHKSYSDWKTKNGERAEKNLLKTSHILAKRISNEKVVKPITHKKITLKNITTNLTSITIPKNSSLVKIAAQEITIAKKKLFTIPRELGIKATDKILLTGNNGVGKSVFLKKLYKQKIEGIFNKKLRVGYFDQNVASSISEGTVISSIMKTTMFDRSSTMQALGDLNLKEHINDKIATLSGGQLVCFNLAETLLGKYNLILLDEPTNFLDISSIEALENFINDYPFAIIIVSHDKKFISDINVKKWEIVHQQLLTPSYVHQNKNIDKENQIELLKFKLDKLMADPNVSIKEIQNISKQLKQLKSK